MAEAQLETAAAQVGQSEAALRQAQLNLDHTIIRAPVDGVVVSRNVDVGQTVAASLQAPTLFLIAQDLTKMQVDTNVDEADVGPRARRPAGDLHRGLVPRADLLGKGRAGAQGAASRSRTSSPTMSSSRRRIPS